MNSLEKVIDKLDTPITRKQLNEIVYLLFCIVIIILPIIPEVYGFGMYSLKNTIFNLTTVITVVALLCTGEKTFKLNNYEKVLIVYLSLVILSCIFTEHGVVNTITGLNGRGEGVITLFSYCATFAIFCRGIKYTEKLIKISLIISVIIASLGIMQACFELPFVDSSINGIAQGTMGNQNFFSSYICLFLPAFCYIYVNCKRYIYIYKRNDSYWSVNLF